MKTYKVLAKPAIEKPDGNRCYCGGIFKADPSNQRIKRDLQLGRIEEFEVVKITEARLPKKKSN